MTRALLSTCLAFTLCLLAPAAALAQDLVPLRVICFGPHPDDCDIRFGGTAAKYIAAGHAVKIVSLTNGDAGHHEQGGGVLAQRRRACASAARLPRHDACASGRALA